MLCVSDSVGWMTGATIGVERLGLNTYDRRGSSAKERLIIIGLSFSCYSSTSWESSGVSGSDRYETHATHCRMANITNTIQVLILIFFAFRQCGVDIVPILIEYPSVKQQYLS